MVKYIVCSNSSYTVYASIDIFPLGRHLFYSSTHRCTIYMIYKYRWIQGQCIYVFIAYIIELYYREAKYRTSIIDGLSAHNLLVYDLLINIMCYWCRMYRPTVSCDVTSIGLQSDKKRHIQVKTYRLWSISHHGCFQQYRNFTAADPFQWSCNYICLHISIRVKKYYKKSGGSCRLVR